MKLHQLSVIKGHKTRKRVGRGNGSKRGTYSGRGCKGQGQRKSGNVRPGFEGGQTPLIRRIPKLKGFRNINRIECQVLNVQDLNVFKDNENINMEVLLEKRIIKKKRMPTKILGYGEITRKVNIVEGIKITKSAKEKITKAGGKVSIKN